MTNADNKDLSVAVIWAGVSLLAASLGLSTPIRLVLAVPLVLFITGHVALRAIGLIAGSRAAHCTYAVGASIGICLMSGLVLNLLGWLTPLGWSGWLTLVTIALCFIARRRGAGRTATFRPPGPGRFRLVHGALIGLAMLIGFGAYGIAARGAIGQRQFRYTAFWMVPESRGEPDRLVIGIESDEAETQVFDVNVTLDDHVVGLWHSIAVKPGQTWLTTLDVAPGPGRLHKAEARLYRPGDNVIYRRVSTVVPGP
jgi:hypothetical protein